MEKATEKDDMSEYYKQSILLYNDISQDKLTFKEAIKRLVELWRLVPANCLVNPFGLVHIMKEKYCADMDFVPQHHIKFKFTVPIERKKLWWQFWKKESTCSYEFLENLKKDMTI